MKNLLKSDFFRLIKSKLTLVVLIIAFVLPIFLMLIYVGLEALVTLVEPEGAEILGMILNGKMFISTTFAFADNFGLVLPIFTSLIICADFSSGTLRNKLTIGYNRHKVYLSYFITIFTYCSVLMVVYAGMNALFGFLVFGVENIDSSFALSLVYFYILGFLGLLIITSIVVCFSLLTFNVAGSIILSLLTVMIFGLVSELVSPFDYSSFEHVMHFFPNFVTTVFSTKNIDSAMFLESLGGIIIFSGIFYALGDISFSKKDLK